MSGFLSGSAASLARAIRETQISSVEALTACLARIEAVNPRLNAVVRVTAAAALGDAQSAAARHFTELALVGVESFHRAVAEVPQRAAARSGRSLARYRGAHRTNRRRLGRLRSFLVCGAPAQYRLSISPMRIAKPGIGSGRNSSCSSRIARRLSE
jgi:hypothetical protein